MDQLQGRKQQITAATKKKLRARLPCFRQIQSRRQLRLLISAKRATLSERDLRKVKNRQKMSGGVRDESGRDMFCSILSFIETCKRRSLPVFQSIGAALNDGPLMGW